MDYQNVIRDFAERTRTNLELVEDHVKRAPGTAFEFTQLVNSMLGLLVFPTERYHSRIPPTPLSDLRESGWPVPVASENLPDPPDLRSFVRYLRNAIAHFNIKFEADGRGQLTGLTVWNRRGGRSAGKTWQATFTAEQLREITHRFIELLLDDESDRISSGPPPS
jgi:hypothetical protein